MYKSIKDFAKQFAFKPLVQNARRLRKHERAIIIGMGGSHLGADIAKLLKPELEIMVHSDYGLPHISSADRKKTLVMFSSYSGNTEEVLDAWSVARQSKLSVAAVSTGGKLLDLAKKAGVSYVELPNTNIQPRMALGFNVLAIAKLLHEEKMTRDLSMLALLLSPEAYAGTGKLLSEKLFGKVPVIYTSARNRALAYNWKIKFNETGKIPAFFNVLPELNHNEMTGFDVVPRTHTLSKNFYFILLKDKNDSLQVQKRMSVLAKLLKARDFSVEISELSDKNPYKKIFASLLIADWAAYYTALSYGVEPEQVPMVEEFKQLIKKK
ncbi:MAG TPA: SIS domain-containing protein [Candidatus Paceibacterota bacterium]